MSLNKDISKFFEKASKKRGLSDQSKTCEDPKKMREDKSSTGNLTDMADDVFAESLRSVHATQDYHVKDEKQLNDLKKSINFLSDKFKDYEKDRAKKDKIIDDLRLELDSLSTKVTKLEKL